MNATEPTLFTDDRTDEQRATHCGIVAMTDSFMSGWGLAAGCKSIAAWACTPDEMGNVERWVRSRSDARYVRWTSEKSLRAAALRGDHVHVYVVTSDHPAHS